MDRKIRVMVDHEHPVIRDELGALLRLQDDMMRTGSGMLQAGV